MSIFKNLFSPNKGLTNENIILKMENESLKAEINRLKKINRKLTSEIKEIISDCTIHTGARK